MLERYFGERGDDVARERKVPLISRRADGDGHREQVDIMDLQEELVQLSESTVVE